MKISNNNITLPNNTLNYAEKIFRPVIQIFKFDRITPAVLVIAALFCIPHFAAAAEFTQQDAHEHGVAHLNVAFAGKEIVIELVSPAANIVGFEHAPSNPAEETAHRDAVRLLEKGASLFQFPVGAECTLLRASVKADFDSDDHQADSEQHAEVNDGGVHSADEHGNELDDEHGDAHHNHDSHNDIRAEYSFRVGRPDKLQHLDVLLLQAFPSIEHMQVQLLTPSAQTAVKLTPENIRIEF